MASTSTRFCTSVRILLEFNILAKKNYSILSLGMYKKCVVPATLKYLELSKKMHLGLENTLKNEPFKDIAQLNEYEYEA